ncbi:MAG: ATP synthase F1 subunit gamma [candidate division Zixibacteria bacterium]|nr:ATP synthase F1 subunit gamma [candidate division Zixibacteria bacterium]
MRGIREIRRRIRSVESTKQITKAMEMVAAAYLRRAQARVEAARPYSEKLRQILNSLAGASDISHPLFEQREVKNTAIVMLTGDRGLCGSYNQNVIRATEILLKEHSQDEVELVTIGKRGRDYFRKRDWKITAEHIDFGGRLDFERTQQIAKDATEMFLSGEVDEVKLIYTRFVSAVTFRVTVADFLPIAKPEVEEGAASLDYIYEPDSESIYAEILPKYIENMVYIAFAESLASEHGARMMAMGNATKNAEDMIDSLTLLRNKVRQASITNELLDLVGGAEALKG